MNFRDVDLVFWASSDFSLSILQFRRIPNDETFQTCAEVRIFAFTRLKTRLTQGLIRNPYFVLPKSEHHNLYRPGQQAHFTRIVEDADLVQLR